MNLRPMIVALAAGAAAYPCAPAFGAEVLGAPADAPDQAERPVARLVVDTSRMFEDEREDTAKWIRDDGLPVLVDAGVTVDDANAEWEIRVAVMVEGVGYAVETTVWRPGADEPEVDRGHRVCEACVRSEVLRLVTRELAWVGGWLTVRPAAETDAPPTQTDEAEEPVTQEPSKASGPPDEPARKPSKTLRNAGLALVVPGGVALGVGIGLIAAGARKVDEPNPLLMAERNYRPSGIALAAGGAAVAATGIAMLVVHARRARHGKGDRMAWTPMIGEARTGVVLTGRF